MGEVLIGKKSSQSLEYSLRPIIFDGDVFKIPAH